jgi:hypothetical protein
MPNRTSLTGSEPFIDDNRDNNSPNEEEIRLEKF